MENKYHFSVYHILMDSQGKRPGKFPTDPTDPPPPPLPTEPKPKFK